MSTNPQGTDTSLARKPTSDSALATLTPAWREVTRKSISIETTTYRHDEADLCVVLTSATVNIEAMFEVHSNANELEVATVLAALDEVSLQPGRYLIAEARSYAWTVPSDAADECDGLTEAFSGTHPDVESVAFGVLKLLQADAVPGMFTERVVVLDAVEVAQPFRGMGLGIATSAHNAYTAGAWSTTVLVAALAGARVEPAERSEVKKRSTNLLNKLGLTGHSFPFGEVFVGHTSMSIPGRKIAELAVGRRAWS